METSQFLREVVQYCCNILEMLDNCSLSYKNLKIIELSIKLTVSLPFIQKSAMEIFNSFEMLQQFPIRPRTIPG